MQPVETWIDRWCRVKDAVKPAGYKLKRRKFKRDVEKEEKARRRKYAQQFFLWIWSSINLFLSLNLNKVPKFIAFNSPFILPKKIANDQKLVISREITRNHESRRTPPGELRCPNVPSFDDAVLCFLFILESRNHAEFNMPNCTPGERTSRPF